MNIPGVYQHHMALCWELSIGGRSVSWRSKWTHTAVYYFPELIQSPSRNSVLSWVSSYVPSMCIADHVAASEYAIFCLPSLVGLMLLPDRFTSDLADVCHQRVYAIPYSTSFPPSCTLVNILAKLYSHSSHLHTRNRLHNLKCAGGPFRLT